MTFYKIKLIIYLDKTYQTNCISNFVGELVKNKTHHFLHLKVEVKSQYIVISGYTLHSVSNNNDYMI